MLTENVLYLYTKMLTYRLRVLAFNTEIVKVQLIARRYSSEFVKELKRIASYSLDTWSYVSLKTY